MSILGLKRSVAFLGNYLPRKCGIATFTTDLAEYVAKGIGNKRDVIAIAMTDVPEGYHYPDRVKFEIRLNTLRDYEQAADFINTSRVDVLCVQHEYGIYGGECGEYLNLLLRKVKVPIVTTLHTILENYPPEQERVLKEIVSHSSQLVTLSKKGVNMLRSTMKVPKDKVVYIPHGIPDLPFVDSNYYKDQFELAGKTILFTFGLLSPGKGIEYMIGAMPKIIKKYPDVVYIVLGITHPDIIKRHGEEYRLKLIRQVKDLGLTNHVFFHNKFVSIDELCDYLCASDFYVVPYLNREQIISGTMAYALGAGKAVISTASWTAEEFLAKGRGRIVPFKNSDAFSQAIDELMINKIEYNAMKKRGYLYGRNMIWSETAREYIKIFNEVQLKRKTIIRKELSERAPILSTMDFPMPKLDHLKAITDDFGVFQHARFTVPDYEHGYCVDDNARACVAATKYYYLFNDPEALSLLKKYLAFLFYAQKPDGSFRNFYDISRSPLDETGSDDCHGRALWGLGCAIAHAPDYFWVVAKASFDKAIPHAANLNLRGTALSVIGIYYYLQRYPGDLNIRTILEKNAEKIVDHFNAASTDKWKWFEKKITYSNGFISLSLWIAYYILKVDKYRDIAKITTDFLIKNCMKNDRISLVGCNGWMSEDDVQKPHFDQQPIDAMCLVELGRFTYKITKDPAYLNLMRLSFDWFLGENDMGMPLYDLVSGGCYDGLTPEGPNLNQGAESTIAAILSLLSITEMVKKESFENT